MARIVTFALSVTFILAMATAAEAAGRRRRGHRVERFRRHPDRRRVIALDPDFVLTVGDHAYRRNREPIQADTTSPRGDGSEHHDAEPGQPRLDDAGRCRIRVLLPRAGREGPVVRARSWLVISLDSNVRIARQRTRLATVLSSDDRRCELLFFHHPRWSSGQNGNQQGVASWWRTAYANGVDVILNGHDHDYEFARKRPSGRVAADGIREFVVGMGGVETRSFNSRKSGSQKRITGNDNWGVGSRVAPGSLPMAFHRCRFRDRLDAGLSRCHT